MYEAGSVSDVTEFSLTEVGRDTHSGKGSDMFVYLNEISM